MSGQERGIFPVNLYELSSSGEAVGTSEDGKVVFVQGGVPGEVVDCLVREEKARFIRADLVAVRSPSAFRVVSPCMLAERMECGGCPWMHVHRETQKEEKFKVVTRALRHFHAEIRPIQTPTPELQYRIRARMIQRQGVIGFQAPRSHAVCSIAACPILEPHLEEVMVNLSAQLSPCLGEEGSLSGVVGIAKEVHVSVTFGRRARSERALKLLTAYVDTGKIVGARIDGTSIGKQTVCIADGPFQVHVSADTFAQASQAGHDQMPALLQTLIQKGMNPSRPVTILELHAGSGNLTRVLLPLAKTLSVVESDPTAARRLRSILPKHATVHAVPDTIAVAAFLRAQERFDIVVLDPPRIGAREVAEQLPRLAREAIVYVSCDPMTLARDAKAIEQGGFSLVEVIPLDLMPHTPHVELVSLFIPNRSSAMEGNNSL